MVFDGLRLIVELYHNINKISGTVEQVTIYKKKYAKRVECITKSSV